MECEFGHVVANFVKRKIASDFFPLSERANELFVLLFRPRAHKTKLSLTIQCLLSVCLINARVKEGRPGYIAAQCTINRSEKKRNTVKLMVDDTIAISLVRFRESRKRI